MLSITAIAVALILYFSAPLIKQIALDKIISNPVATLGSAEKERLYRLLAADLAGIYDAVPDGDVGKILQKNINKKQHGTRVITNSAGFRDKRTYGPKSETTFRIICLGDSFVEGTGGNVEDRFCDRIEASINQYDLLGAGSRAEAYALGVGSWTAVNAATYMISHLTAYDPDLIIVLMVSNDIADGQGVNGIGLSSNAFSPEQRGLGSGLFSTSVSLNFGEDNFLMYDLGPESVKRWEKAFSRYKKLENLQQQRGKKMIFSVLDTIPFFSELARSYHAEFEMDSPFLTTSYFPAKDTTLPHNPHPNRDGHQIMANHYLHTLVRLGWLSDPDNQLMRLHPGLSLETAVKPDMEFQRKTRHTLARKYIPEEINFDHLDTREIQSFLGGIWPDMTLPAEIRRQSYPYGSTKTGFYLSRVNDATRANVDIYLPPRIELYPNTIRLFVNGELSDSVTLDTVDQYGEKTLSAGLESVELGSEILEIIITSDTYWSTITDNTMRSYQLRRAFQSRGRSQVPESPKSPQ